MLDSKIRFKDANQMHLEGKVHSNPKIYRALGRYKNKSSLFSSLAFYFPGGLSSCWLVWPGSLYAWSLGVYHEVPVGAAAGKRTFDAFIMHQLPKFTAPDAKVL